MAEYGGAATAAWRGVQDPHVSAQFTQPTRVRVGRSASGQAVIARAPGACAELERGAHVARDWGSGRARRQALTCAPQGKLGPRWRHRHCRRRHCRRCLPLPTPVHTGHPPSQPAFRADAGRDPRVLLALWHGGGDQREGKPVAGAAPVCQPAALPPPTWRCSRGATHAIPPSADWPPEEPGVCRVLHHRAGGADSDVLEHRQRAGAVPGAPHLAQLQVGGHREVGGGAGGSGCARVIQEC